MSCGTKPSRVNCLWWGCEGGEGSPYDLVCWGENGRGQGWTSFAPKRYRPCFASNAEFTSDGVCDMQHQKLAAVDHLQLRFDDEDGVWPSWFLLKSRISFLACSGSECSWRTAAPPSFCRGCCRGLVEAMVERGEDGVLSGAVRPVGKLGGVNSV